MTESDLKIVRGEIAAALKDVADEWNKPSVVMQEAFYRAAHRLESPPVKVEELKIPPMDYWQYRARRNLSPYRRYEGDATAELDNLAKLIVSGEYAITKVESK